MSRYIQGTDRIQSPTYALDPLSPVGKLACACVDDGKDLGLSNDIPLCSNTARNLYTARSGLRRLG